MAEPQPKTIDLLNAAAADGGIHVSFEFFPPKTDKGDETLMNNIESLKRHNPVFIDFTWGAGGTTSEKTTKLSLLAKERHNLVVNMHLTCTNMPEGKVHEALEFCKTNGIRNIIALRGDPPAGQEWRASADGFSCALDLVKYIRQQYGDFFCIGVAGYPEGHPDRISKETGLCTEADMDTEIAYLKSKVEAGGDFIITQLFYDNRHFLAFMKRCREAGINCPVLPGMLPMLNYGGLNRMVSLCRTDLPESVKQRVEAIKDDDAAVKEYGIELTTAMCKELMEHGVRHFHFYTLNLEYSTVRVLENLGLAKSS